MQGKLPFTGRLLAAMGLAAICLCAIPAIVRADSLFPTKLANKTLTGSSAARSASLYTDSRAHEVGDVLTITIAENTSAQSSANTKTQHDDSVTAFGGQGGNRTECSRNKLRASCCYHAIF